MIYRVKHTPTKKYYDGTIGGDNLEDRGKIFLRERGAKEYRAQIRSYARKEMHQIPVTEIEASILVPFDQFSKIIADLSLIIRDKPDI